MSWLTALALTVLHAVYHLILVFKSLVSRTRKAPLPLTATRAKLPFHLALALVADPHKDEETNERYMLDSVDRVADWCQAVGIRRLTVYDREGLLANCSLDIRDRLVPAPEREDADHACAGREIQYPPTPPPSDDADSRPLSPHLAPPVPKLGVTTIQLPPSTPKPKRRTSVSVKRRRVARNSEKPEELPLTLHVISFKSGKPAVAAAATTLLGGLRDGPAARTSESSIQELSALLEGEYGFPSPDLMIVHRKPPAEQLRSPVELHGFPPWQTRLTEIYWEPYTTARRLWGGFSEKACSTHIEEIEFRRALDEFAAAEMRVGK